ncbi:MAG TPA: radical SAM family heme chaperone HemW [Bryobacteraceae bacterium]
MSGVYICYPFCSQKCSFCNFASGVFSAAAQRAYEGRLLSEIQAHGWDWQPETAYLGGGTPSLMPLELLRAIMHAIPGQKLGETTIECAPGTIDSEKIRAWAEAGINRVSLGVQSFVTSELRQVGRRHTAEIVEAEIKLLRQFGIENINIDLIAGLPGQTFASWKESLDWIERLAPPHVSVYLFEIDEDSRLGKEALAGGMRYGAGILPSDEAAAEFYEQAVERLQGCGIERYEISNFGRPGWESRHNLKYWRLEPYIGFGVDAHSFDGRERWSNPESPAEYLEWEGHRPRTASDVEEERFFAGLRLMEGIEPAEHEWLRFAEPIDKWVQAGYLERSGARLRLAPQGVLVSNEIFQDFVA